MPWGGPEATTILQNIKASSEYLTRNQQPVGAAGFAVINDELQIPPNDFFVSGRKFEARIVHSSFPGKKTSASHYKGI